MFQKIQKYQVWHMKNVNSVLEKINIWYKIYFIWAFQWGITHFFKNQGCTLFSLSYQSLLHNPLSNCVTHIWFFFLFHVIEKNSFCTSLLVLAFKDPRKYDSFKTQVTHSDSYWSIISLPGKVCFGSNWSDSIQYFINPLWLCVY